MKYLTTFVLLLSLVVEPLYAAETLGLYQAEVPVADQGDEARAQGMQEAMGDVLLKVSGTMRVLDNEELILAMGNPKQYVQQYRYRNEPIPEERQVPDDEGQIAKERLLLSVSFDQKTVDGLLRANGYTAWSETRPLTLLWLAVEQGKQRVLVGANDQGLVREFVDQAVARRGLPVTLPSLDTIDQSAISMADIWGDFIDRIQQASMRYQPQAILVGRLYPTPERQWELRWTLIYQGEVQRWLQQSLDVSQLLTDGINQTTEQLAQRFAINFVSGSEEVILEIDNVIGLDAYTQIIDYLGGLPGVKEVTTNHLLPEAVSVKLHTEGGSKAALQAIAMGKLLQEITPPTDAPTEVKSPDTDSAPKEPATDENGTPVEPAAPPPTRIIYYRMMQ